MELIEGAVIADRFRLVRQLGEGGMGEVWLAQHTALDIPCAVKFIHAEVAAHEEVRSRFEREAKAAASLRSSNVVQILDYGVYEQTPYIAMELLEGEELSDRLSRQRVLSPHETFRIVAQVGRALTKAHAAGIVHRDLKPENVFLVKDDDAEIAKVLDFGVAKNTLGIADSNTKTGALLGTPYYMSPEQAQGIKAVDSRADLWSLAILTFRCMTGELPFNSEALGDLLIKIVTHPIPVPSHVANGLPPGFDQWWERASQRDPDHRFQTAKELVEALGLSLGVSTPSGLGVSGMSTGTAPGVPGQPAAAVDPAWMDSGITPAPVLQQTGGGSHTGPGAPYPMTPATVAAGPTPVGIHAATAAMPAADATGPSAALGYVPHGTPALAQSGSGASVAGFATHAGQTQSSPRGALIAVVLAATVVVASLGAFVVYRTTATGSDAAGESVDGVAATGPAEPDSSDETTVDDGAATADPGVADGAESVDGGRDSEPTEQLDGGAEPDSTAVAKPTPRPRQPGPKPKATTSPEEPKPPGPPTNLGDVKPAPTKEGKPGWGF